MPRPYITLTSSSLDNWGILSNSLRTPLNPTMPRLNVKFNNPKPFSNNVLDTIMKYCIQNNDELIQVGTAFILKSELLSDPRFCYYNNRQDVPSCPNNICQAQRTWHYSREYFKYDYTNNKFLRIVHNPPIKYNEYCTKYTDLTSRCKAINKSVCNSCAIPLESKLYDLLPAKERICYNCYSAAYYACKICGTREKSSKNGFWQFPTGVGTWCIACYESVYTKCTSCGKVVPKEQADDDGCDYCQKEAINKWDYKPIPVFLTPSEPLMKRPGKDPFFGVELEVEMKEDFKDLTNKIARRFSKDVAGFAYLKADGTINNGFEIVSHPGNYEWWHTKNNPLFKSLRRLSKTCESYWAQNCGLHVHISKDAFKSVYHMAKFICFIVDNPLFMAFIAERYQKHQAPINIQMVQDPYGAAKGNYSGNRHTAVNIWDHNGGIAPNTIEIRIFKGNMRPSRILKDIEYLQAVFDFTLSDASGGINVNSNFSEILESQKEVMTVGRFRDFVYSANDKYPNLAKFIENYKRNS